MKCSLLTLLALTATLAAEPATYEVTIEALVDGPSTLHFTKTGFFWQNEGNAKPGRHDAHNEPTYVNSRPWTPKWRKPEKERGDDTSDTFPWVIGSLELECELVAVTRERGGSGIEKRTPLERKRDGGEYTVRIPDPEGGSRWYRIVVRAPDPLRPRSTLPPRATATPAPLTYTPPIPPAATPPAAATPRPKNDFFGIPPSK